MEDKEVKTQEIAGKIREYVRVRKELAVLSAVEKGSRLFANMLTGILFVLFALLTFFFGSLALGLYLNDVVGNPYGGFLILTGFYLLITIIVYTTKDKYMEKRIIDAVIAKFFKDRDEDR